MITNITNTSLSILEIRNGENWRRAFCNSSDGRITLQTEFPDAYFEVCGEGKPWGTEPTVAEEAPLPNEPIPDQPNIEQRVSNCEADIEQIVTGLEALANG